MSTTRIKEAALYDWETHHLNQYGISHADPELARATFLTMWNEACDYMNNEKKYTPALNRFHQALNAVFAIEESQSASEDHYLAYSCLLKSGECLQMSHDYAGAIIHYQAALKEVEAGIDEHQSSVFISDSEPFVHQLAYSEAFSKMAACYYQLGVFAKAQFYFQMAVISSEAALTLHHVNKDSARIADAEHHFDAGMTDLALNKFSRAADSFVSSAKGYEALPEKIINVHERERIYTAYHCAGKACLMSHDYEMAKGHFDRAYQYSEPLVKETRDRKHLDATLEILENLAYVNIKTGHVDEAKMNYELAEKKLAALKHVIEGKRYRMYDRARLENSFAAAKQMVVQNPSAAYQPPLIAPRQTKKSLGFHFMRFFNRKQDSSHPAHEIKPKGYAHR